MKKCSLLAVFLVVVISALQSQIVSYTFNDSPNLNASSKNDSVTCSRFLISSGSIDSLLTTGTYFTDEPYISVTGGWTATSLASAKYFYFTINAIAGFTFALSEISVQAYATSAGPSALSILINDTPIDTVDVPDQALITVSANNLTGFNDLTTATIKIVGWDNASRTTTGGGAFRLDNIILNGHVNDQPPIVASQLKIEEITIPIYTDSAFNMIVNAINSNGIVDTTYSETVFLSGTSTTGTLGSANGLSADCTNGSATFTNLIFTSTDTLTIEARCTGLTSAQTAPILIGKYIFANNFESAQLTTWQNTTDWICSTDNALNGNYSLKHNLTDSSGSSYIVQAYTDSSIFGESTTCWQLKLANGNFDPTSTNKFWYYLMADTINLNSDAISGYVVGVNFYGSTDSLSLWRIDNNGYKSLLLQTDLDWNENTLAAIEVSRTAKGIWQLGYNTSGSFSNLTYSTKFEDITYSTALYHGLFFSFSTTRAGLLQCDDLNFFQLNSAPNLLNAEAIESTLVQVVFSEKVSEASATELSNYSLVSGNGNSISIQSIEYNPSLPQQVILTTGELSAGSYTLTVQNIADMDSWPMETQSFTFAYSIPAQLHEVVINEIMFDPTPVVELPEYDFFEIYNNTTNSFNLKNWTVDISGTKKTLPDSTILPGEYIIITSSGALASFSSFGKTINGMASTALTTTGKTIRLFNAQNELIDSVSYLPDWYNNDDKTDGGWTLERIDVTNFCSGKDNWRASVNAAGGTPGQINSVAGTYNDATAPTLISYKLTNQNTIKLIFSENIDTLYLSANNFTIDQTAIDAFSILEDNITTLILSQNTPFVAGQSYVLKIKNIADACGNSLSDTTITIQYNLINEGDIVISELMADPSPVIGLPEYEFIELTNRSAKTINLENWLLTVKSKTCTLDDFTLYPDSMVILCSSGAVEDFSAFGTALKVTSFPSLTNAGAEITLSDSAENIISQVSYNDTWYNDDEKAEGGWSLEKIDLDNLCGQEQNWRASVNAAGGTPGHVNSVAASNIDNTPVSLVNLAPINAHQIWLEFSEPLIIDYAINPANYSLSSLGQPGSATIDSTSKTEVWLTYNTAMISEQSYSLAIENLTDFCENTPLDTTVDFSFVQPQRYDLVINEIMANPEPSVGLPEAEYIELHNNLAFDACLYNYTLTIGSSERNIDYTTIPANGYLILCGTDDISLFESYGNVAAVDNLPAIPLSGTVILKNNNAEVICATSYSSDWIDDDFKTEGGYSLERIDFSNPDESQDNWQASNDNSGGTPGTINSVYSSTSDTKTFRLLSVAPISSKSVVIQFNKAVDHNYSASIFSVDEEVGSPDSVVVSDVFYQTFILYFSREFTTNTLYTLSIDESLADLSGNVLENTNSEFMLPELATENDLVINEVLYNPHDDGVDFVELYNRSAKPINLAQLIIATRDDDGNIKTHYALSDLGKILLPGEFTVISTNGSAIQSQYIIKDPLAFTDIESMPTLANDAGTVVIMDTNAVIIDEFSYTEDMQFGLLESTEGVSLERINYEKATSNTGNWHSAAEAAGWATPGYKNSVYMDVAEVSDEIKIEPEAFSPDNDGYNDVTNIYYNFDAPGYVANVNIYNSRGVKIRELIQNELLAQSGDFTWDGLTDHQDKAPIGIYIVDIKIFDLDGNTKGYRKTCVVSARL